MLIDPPAQRNNRNCVTKDGLAGRGIAALICCMILLLSSPLWSQSQREYIYMDGRLIAIESTESVPPTITITSPTTGSTYSTTSSPLTVGGTASDNIGVTQVTWANSRGGSGSCTGTTSWTCGSIALLEGQNIITVTARDAASNPGTDTLTVTYTVCTYSISPTSVNIEAGGGGGVATVTCSCGCPWTANSNNAWIIVTSGSSGSGNGSVVYSAANNDTGSTRIGTITIAGQTFTVNQAASTPCTYSINPESYDVPASGGTGLFVSVITGAGCPWTAVSNRSWIAITSGSSGTGNGSVIYRVTVNKYGPRTGTMTIAGRTFTVYQDAGSLKAPSNDEEDGEQEHTAALP